MRFLLTILLLLILTQKINSTENKIIFKINNKAFTTLDYQIRSNYLNFVNTNSDLSKEIILNDFISAIIFYEYFINSKNKINYDDKIREILENIKEINKNNSKNLDNEIDEEDILFNLKIDFIRKSILENILNENLNQNNIKKEEIDLLYNLKIDYIIVDKNNYIKIKHLISKLNNIDSDSIRLLLNENNIEFFKKTKEIIDINKIDKRIKNNILKNSSFFIIDNNQSTSLIFVKKKFETLDGLTATLVSLKSPTKVNNEDLLCKNLLKTDNTMNIITKDYKFMNLNNQIKKNLININDFIILSNENNENVYVVLCDIKSDKKILDNLNLNKFINNNVTEIEKNFIKKYSKIFNLIKLDE